jgi:ABC-2 type transport system ATP-binding protein
MGVMLQAGGVHPGVRPLEALRHAAALYPRPLAPAPLLDRLGLTGRERRTWRQLSGGEQRRLALGLALVGRPQVAFLDEPTAGVDPAGRQTIREIVRELRDDGVTVLLTSHDLDEAERLADDVVIVDRARLVARGTLAELTGGPGVGDRVRFSAPAGLDTAALSGHLGGVPVAEGGAGRYEVAAPPTPATVAAITAWLADHDLPLADLHAGRQRLEDVFLRLTSGEPTDTETTAGPGAAAEPPATSEPAGEPTDGEPTDDETTAGDTADRESADAERPSDQPTDSEPASDQPTDSQPAGHQPTDSQPASDQPTDSEPAGDQPTESQPAPGEPADREPGGGGGVPAPDET